jgi:hypothetical protein
MSDDNFDWSAWKKRSSIPMKRGRSERKPNIQKSRVDNFCQLDSSSGFVPRHQAIQEYDPAHWQGA